MRPLLRILLAVFFALYAAPLLAQVDARLMRMPAVSASQVAFVYGGDIWVVARSGGTAQRLSTPKGTEGLPRFSPDGALLAFTGNYDGNTDVYVVPASGGMPARLTHHPAQDLVLGWYPDGRSLLIASDMASGTDRFHQLYKLPAAGGLADRLPVPYGEFGAVSPDGKTLAYVPNSQDFRTWKRYRGGDVSRLYLFDLTTHAARRVGDDGASYSQPMWHGATLYFLSDRDEAKRYNIWALDTATGAMRQVTAYRDFDVHFPSIGPADIVFENGGRLYLLDLATEKAREVRIQVVTDEATLKPRAEQVADSIASFVVSPSGKRALIEARGDLFSVPAENGVTLNLTRTSGVAERYPAWSPDGKTVAYWSDRSGEYELTLRNADGTGEERTVTQLGPGYRYPIFWSPDSSKVAYADQAMGIYLCDVATGKVTRVDQGLYLFHEVQSEGMEGLETFRVSWSADSRWAAWSREMPSQMGAIFLHDTQTGKTTQVTSGFYYDSNPVFDPEGKYLYYFTKRSFKPDYGLDSTWIYANLTQLAAVPLRADVPSPVAPRNDVEAAGKAETEKRGDRETGGVEKKKEAAKPEPVKIDLAGFEERAVLLPPKVGNYADLTAVKGKVLFRRLPRTGSDEEKSPVLWYDFEEREEKTILEDADAYELAAGGEKLLVQSDKDYAIVDVKPDQKMEKKLDTSSLEMTVDPMAEWKQIFSDAWRFERDYFYDPHMHGVDWKAMRERYGALIGQCVTRGDVNFVLGELIAELNSSHTYRGGGDQEKPAEREAGLLGADFALENGAYRIQAILQGAPWDVEARSPLKEPGLGVKEGDYLLAVNGARVDTAKDPWAALDGLSGKTCLLTVNDKPDLTGSRQVLVKALDASGEARLRHLDWINRNRLKVEQATGGRVGYLYVPDTGTDGQNELYRQFMGQYTKDGLIIDERFNSGGQIPDRFVELLDRPVNTYWAVRDGRDWQWPPFANRGPKVMLINGWSGSGGDCFPLYFRMAKLGPLVGRRTWGGLIGISGSPSFVDRGQVTVPTFGIYDLSGKWIVEGRGVEPDIPVDDDPAQMADGGDPQLDRAVQEVLRLLKENPPAAPRKPAYEDRSK
jgi:tricorn protease